MIRLTMKRLFIFAMAITAVLIIGCSPKSNAHSESLVNQLEHQSEHVEPVDMDISELFMEYTLVEVETDSAQPFHTLSHTEELEKYPCSSCHEAPLGDTATSDVEPEPHWDITLDHASADVMTCTTCHTSDNLDTLHTLTDTTVEFDNSYQVCAQCHSSQFTDWTGGAHGKRIEGWAEPRVIETCVGCHNPHAPGWDKRWPAVTGGGIED